MTLSCLALIDYHYNSALEHILSYAAFEGEGDADGVYPRRSIEYFLIACMDRCCIVSIVHFVFVKVAVRTDSGTTTGPSDQ